MSISEKNKQFICGNLYMPPCNYEDVMLYYQETANIYCEPFEESFMVKNFYDERDI